MAASMLRMAALLLGFLYMPSLVDAAEVLHGQHRQAVVGCKCKGEKRGKSGGCGYHYGLMSAPEKPWCRTLYSCGEQSLLGSWTFCDEKSLERRRGDDGKLYTAKEMHEFIHYNGKKDGKKKWEQAKPYIEKRLAKNKKAYTVAEFREFYVDWYGEGGWVEHWVNAKPEERKANDGYWYTWEGFQKFYGKDAWNKWAGSEHSEL